MYFASAEEISADVSQLQRFTADASHELRTPLASLRMIGEVTVSASRSEDEYVDAISSILEETARLNETIESLLLLARAEAANPERVEAIPPAQLLDEVLSVFAVVAEEREIRFRQEDSAGGNTRVRAERTLLRVALMNVVYNAIKFSPNSGVIRTWIEGQPDRTVRISIEDQGPGIPQDETERVFDRFYTGRAAQTSSTKGTGLGLPIARLIVERAGGGIAFNSSNVRGACCVITLPVCEGTSDSNRHPAMPTTTW